MKKLLCVTLILPALAKNELLDFKNGQFFGGFQDSISIKLCLMAQNKDDALLLLEAPNAPLNPAPTRKPALGRAPTPDTALDYVVSKATMQSWYVDRDQKSQKPSEDRHGYVLKNSVRISYVCDGSGGSEVSEPASKYFNEEFDWKPIDNSNKDAEELRKKIR